MNGHEPNWVLTAAEMRAAEGEAEAAGISLSALMDRAGRAVADAVLRFGAGQPVLILCGPGNNGGDGYVAAALLKAAGLDVRVAACDAPRTDLARAARARWDGPVEALAEAVQAPVIVDALFGTGLTRKINPEIAVCLRLLLNAAAFSIAVDLPSGIGSDDGAWLGAGTVHLTLALGALKPGHLLQPGASYCGHVRCADIGLSPFSTTQRPARPKLFAPDATAHKYSRGMVAVVGGTMGGAAMLAARAAMPYAGYVALVGARRTGPLALVNRRFEDVAQDARVRVLLIGPGLGRDEKARALLTQALAAPHALVLDADALMLLSPTERDALGTRSKPVILTPHEGEFTHLFGALPGSKIDRARAAAARCGATIILKGADTVIAAPDGSVSLSEPAPSWLASAGTGDVLAGLVSGVLSVELPNGGSSTFSAAQIAVWLHGDAARRAGAGLIADDLIGHIPAAMEACL